MSALGQKQTSQQVSGMSALAPKADIGCCAKSGHMHRSKFQVAARFLDAEDHAVARSRALRQDRGDAASAQRGNRYGLQVRGMRLSTASFD